MLDAVRWTCATCYRPEKVRVGSLCWDCWSVLHRAPVAALRVVKARPPRHPRRVSRRPGRPGCGLLPPGRVRAARGRPPGLNTPPW